MNNQKSSFININSGAGTYKPENTKDKTSYVLNLVEATFKNRKFLRLFSKMWWDMSLCILPQMFQRPWSKSRYRAVIHNNFICLSKDVSPDVKLRYEADHCNKLPRQKKVSWPDVPSSYSFIFLHTTATDATECWSHHPDLMRMSLRWRSR